jgi:signal transduction histidine kinase/ActR/RegA family two-component response regulator
MAIEGTDFAAHVLVPRASAKSVELARLQGEDFLHVLVEDLQRRLDVAFVFLGDLVGPDWERITTIAIAGRAGLLPNITYDLAGTPCERVASGEVCVHPSGVLGLYPHDKLAHEMGMDSYVGSPLCDEHGRIVGMIGASDTRPIESPETALGVLLEYATRIAGELARRRDAALVRTMLECSDVADASASWRQLAASLCEALHTRSGLVSELLPGEPHRFRVRGISIAGELRSDLEGQEIKLAGSPCEKVFERGWMFHASKVARIYPAFAPTMELLGRESYLGLVYCDREGVILGHVAVAHDRTMLEGTSPQGLLRFFALRAAAELERERATRLRMETGRRELARQRMESLGLLAGGVAHDFNNLLVGILGNASMARAEAHGSLREHLDKIERAARRASDLSNQLLAYSGKGRFVVGNIDVNGMCEETAQLLKSSLPPRVQVRLELEPNLPRVRADGTQLGQVLMNLLLNGADAIGSAPGLLTVRTTTARMSREELAACAVGGEAAPAGHYVRIEVIDTGCGMDRETLARIFDPFFTTKFTGRGLGLAAVQGIVKSHHGALAIESSPGRGSSFRVFLPPSGELIPAGESAAIAHGPSAAGPRRCLLIVDDEELVRRSARRMLEHLGHEVREARGGEEALVLLRQDAGAVHAVLLDMTMPGMDGEATFHAVRKLCPKLPVVLMSGYDESETLARFPRQDLAGFLRKPFDLDQLAKRVRASLAAPGAA